MDVFVVVATKGRAADCRELVSWLDAQTLQPRSIVFMGSEAADVSGLEERSEAGKSTIAVRTANRVGTSIQRNAGLRALAEVSALQHPYVVVFFDDDFRPARDWLEQCARFFEQHPEAVGVTGRVLADGVRGPGISNDGARAYLSNALPPEKHWASGDEVRPIDCVYGCNMAFRDIALAACTFDEDLPLYAWQEDQDFSAQAARVGGVYYVPSCRGVHLGSKGGRSNGLRLGYSQIANPIYLMRKGTMSRRKGVKFLLRAMASNSLRSLFPHPLVDYKGRLVGNARAVFDLTRGRCHPNRVLEFR